MRFIVIQLEKIRFAKFQMKNKSIEWKTRSNKRIKRRNSKWIFLHTGEEHMEFFGW